MVSNTPGVVEEATADTAIFLILAALRGFNNGIMAIRNGTWRGHVPPPPLGHDPQGKVLGILGLGGIGKNLKRKAEVFGMKVIYHNRTRLSEEMADGAEYVGFDDLLAKSDVLSLNLPLNVSIPHANAPLCRLIGESLIPVEDEKFHLHQGVRQDEAWHCYCEYRSRRRHG